MAKFKSSAKPGASTTAPKRAAPKRAATKKAAKPSAAKSERAATPTASLSAGAQNIMDAAQQIWQTSVDALGRAQQEGTRLFEALVREGVNVEKNTRSLAAGKVTSMRDSVETRVDQVKDRATDTWDRLEKLFEERVQRALTRLGVPGREELQSLVDRVDELNARLRELAPKPTAAAPSGTPKTPKAKDKPARAVSKKPVARKPAAKRAAASKPAASKPAASKPAASKPAASKPAASKPAASKPAASKSASARRTGKAVAPADDTPKPDATTAV